MLITVAISFRAAKNSLTLFFSHSTLPRLLGDKVNSRAAGFKNMRKHFSLHSPFPRGAHLLPRQKVKIYLNNLLITSARWRMKSYWDIKIVLARPVQAVPHTAVSRWMEEEEEKKNGAKLTVIEFLIVNERQQQRRKKKFANTFAKKYISNRLGSRRKISLFPLSCYVPPPHRWDYANRTALFIVFDRIWLRWIGSWFRWVWCWQHCCPRR